MIEIFKRFINEKSVLEIIFYSVIVGFFALSICLNFLLEVYHELQTGRYFIINIIIAAFLLILLLAVLFVFVWIVKFFWNIIPLSV
jgi:hypothetical protein